VQKDELEVASQRSLESAACDCEPLLLLCPTVPSATPFHRSDALIGEVGVHRGEREGERSARSEGCSSANRAAHGGGGAGARRSRSCARRRMQGESGGSNALRLGHAFDSTPAGDGDACMAFGELADWSPEALRQPSKDAAGREIFTWRLPIDHRCCTSSRSMLLTESSSRL